jgi:hypothetical protein
MDRKRRHDPKFLSDPRAKYMVLVGDVLEELVPRFQRLDPPVTYHTYFGDFAGGPGMTIWYAFADRTSKERALANGVAGEIRRETETALVQCGYPQDTLKSKLFLDFTSDEEIEMGDGRFCFFR